MSIEFLGIHVFSSSFVSAVFELGNKFYVLRGAEGEKGSKLYNNPGSSLLRGMGEAPHQSNIYSFGPTTWKNPSPPSQVLILSPPKVTSPSPIDTNFQVIPQ